MTPSKYFEFTTSLESVLVIRSFRKKIIAVNFADCFFFKKSQTSKQAKYVVSRPLEPQWLQYRFLQFTHKANNQMKPIWKEFQRSAKFLTRKTTHSREVSFLPADQNKHGTESSPFGKGRIKQWNMADLRVWEGGQETQVSIIYLNEKEKSKQFWLNMNVFPWMEQNITGWLFKMEKNLWSGLRHGWTWIRSKTCNQTLQPFSYFQLLSM